MINNQDYTVIIGCGRLGSYLANMLSERNKNVLIIDENKNAFRKLASTFGGLTIVGDATNFDVLNDALIKNSTTVVIVTNNDSVNIMLAQIIKEFYKNAHVITRLYDPEYECVYLELGINTICPMILSANEINQLIEKMSKENHI